MRTADIEGELARWQREGRARLTPDGLHLRPRQLDVHQKLRAVYDWLSNEALVCPYVDMHFGPAEGLLRSDHASPSEFDLRYHADEGFASYILLPLLNLITERALLFIGAPGRGKTTLATLMALLDGSPLADVRRATQHGHPQLTISDLLGSPLPSSMIEARDAAAIELNWRGWIKRRVKIIDEYNRIPTKTQSALLSLLAEGYAEMYEQTIEAGRSAWYLTANDELGGGTFQVIQALSDRIDIVVRAVPFSSHHTHILDTRLTTQGGRAPEEGLPSELVFSAADFEAMAAAVREIPVAEEALEFLGAFSAQLEFCRRAAREPEFMTKDTLHVAGRTLAQVCNEDCPLDKHEQICTQSESGISARTQLATIHFAKALAYFRGAAEVSLAELWAILPWTLHHKLSPNQRSIFFQHADHRVLLNDKVAWIRNLITGSAEQLESRHRHRDDQLGRPQSEQSLSSMADAELESESRACVRAMTELANQFELNALVHRDLLALKTRHARYRRELCRRRSRGRAPHFEKGDGHGQ